MPKISDFPYPIYDLTKHFRYPIYGLCGWHSCPKHNVWRAFVGGLIDNDEKVASCKKHTLFLTHFWPKWPKSIPYMTKTGWKTIPFGAAHTYIAHVKEYLSPPGSGVSWCVIHCCVTIIKASLWIPISCNQGGSVEAASQKKSKGTLSSFAV